MKTYSVLKTIFISLSTITTSIPFKSEHNETTQQIEYVNDFANYLKLDFRKISEEMIQNIFEKAEKLNMEVNDFLAIEKYNNNFLLLWYSNGDHFIHVYNRGSSHKGTNLYALCEDIIKKQGFEYPVENRMIDPDETFMVSHPELSKMLDFPYASTQPDIALMTLLLDGNAMVANEFVNRGWPKYGNTFEECESEYFENNPELKKYSISVKHDWDSNFVINLKE